MYRSNVVDRVAAKHLCSACGVCVGECPARALSMGKSALGDPVPVQTAACLPKCHVCLDCCPFAGGEHNPRPKNQILFHPENGSPSVFDSNIGWHIRSLAGHVKAGEIRARAASGGLVTWCLRRLLLTGAVDRVGVLEMHSDCRGAPLFRFKSTDSPAEIVAAAGTVYYPVSLSDLANEILAGPPKRWALVGVPCLCAAVRNSPRLRKRVPYLLGLACGMYQNEMYTEVLLSASGVHRAEVSTLHYRVKPDRPPASNFQFVASDDINGRGRPIPYHGLPLFLGNNAYFRLNSCNFCRDVFAETADACFMDAWLPSFSLDTKGNSLVVTRDARIDELLKSGIASHELELQDAGPEQVVASQASHVRRKRELIHLRLGQAEVPTGCRKPTMHERLVWWLQQHTQDRSKKAWAPWGRSRGLIPFWLSMLDLVVAQLALKGFMRYTDRALRAWQLLQRKIF